jgi:hypothetical protein
MGIGIDMVRPHEDLQIAEQMPDDKKEHHAAGGGHDILPPERGAEQIAQQLSHLSLATSGQKLMQH